MIYRPAKPVEPANLKPIITLEHYIESNVPDQEDIVKTLQEIRQVYEWAEYIRQLTELLLAYDSHGELFWNFEGSELKFYILCNDVFWWATADVESIPPEKLPILKQALEDGGSIWGTQLYCARARGMRPQQPAYPKDPQFRALFDACGPERKKDDEG